MYIGFRDFVGVVVQRATFWESDGNEERMFDFVADVGSGVVGNQTFKIVADDSMPWSIEVHLFLVEDFLVEIGIIKF